MRSLQIIDHASARINFPSDYEAQDQSDLDKVGDIVNLSNCRWCGELKGEALLFMSEHEDASPCHLLLLGIADRERRWREGFIDEVERMLLILRVQEDGDLRW